MPDSVWQNGVIYKKGVMILQRYSLINTGIGSVNIFPSIYVLDSIFVKSTNRFMALR